jgi:uroporphyrinogen decarboxylase
MTHRERILAAFNFRGTDRLPLDLMEGYAWSELLEDFQTRHSLSTPDQIQDFLDTDCRWAGLEYVGPRHDPGLAVAVKTDTEPAVFEAFISRQHEFYMDILRRGLQAARGICDICWLGDDYASQTGMIFSPELWRKLIKPYLAKQVALVRTHGLYVLFHSCGNIRKILPDLIDIGVNAHLVFQTTASDMDAASIAAEFGGRLTFYGGIDVQHLLSFGTPADVAEAVAANARAFARCGGYIVANSHHGVATIQGRNIEAMCEAAKTTRRKTTSA